MNDFYKTCDEIPLCKFIEMYKGDINALVKSGTPSREDLERAAVSMLDEYSALTNNKNIAIEIEDRNNMVNHNIKLVLLEAGERLIEAGAYPDASEILEKVGVKMKDSPSLQDVMAIKKQIRSKTAQIRYSLSVLERNRLKAPDPKDKDFTRERMVVSSHFKMRIDPQTFTAAEYGNLIKIMVEQLKEIERYGK
jgi:hypothetical protein